MRRVPIDGSESSVGAHRPEVVGARLADAIATNVTHLTRLENTMADTTWAAIMARLDAVVAAAANAKTTAEAEVAADVEQRVAALEAALGVTPPADPTVDPNVDPTVGPNVPA